LADQRGAGVEQALHGPRVPGRDRVRARPVRVAAAGRMTGDVEEILGGERETGQRTARRAGNAHGWARDEGTAHGAQRTSTSSSAGQPRPGVRATRHVASVTGAALVRPANTGASRCFWYQSCAQNGSSWNMCTWLKRSVGWLPAYSTSALSGPRM